MLCRLVSKKCSFLKVSLAMAIKKLLEFYLKLAKFMENFVRQ